MSYGPEDIQRLVSNSQNSITRARLEDHQEYVYFQGILQKRAGNFTLKASWHERYFVLATVLLRTSASPRAETIKTTGLFYFEIEDDNPFSPASMKAPLQGYFDL